MDKKDRLILKWIFNVSGKTLWWTALLMLVRIVQGYTCILYAYALGSVVDQAAAGISDAFYSHLAFFIALVVFTVVIQSLGRYISEKSFSLLDRAFRTHTFSELLHRDYAKITQTHTGEWMNRIISDTAVISRAVATILPELAGALVRMVGALIALLNFAPRLVYILLPCSLLMVLFSYFFRKKIKLHHKKAQQADGVARSFMQERLYSLLVVRSFTQEKASEELGKKHTDNYIATRMRRFHFVNLSHTALSIAMNGAQVLGVGLCGFGILNGLMSYGTMSSILYLINMLETPMAMISSYISQYYSMLASAERLIEIEDFESGVAAFPIGQGEIHKYYDEQFYSVGLENACFAYENENEKVLKNLNLDIHKGEFIAFTGESGCGKSTALKLLLNLYPLDSGNAYLQNTDGSRHSLNASWRGLFAYVPQGNQLISGTIRETITFSDPDLMKQEEKLYQALKIACADGFVDELPNGLDTILGERGSGLSEGQMQRLSVARAILSERPILLLDEATSALDAPTEEQLLKNIRSMTNRTVLIITHREAALSICDKRIHFENID